MRMKKYKNVSAYIADYPKGMQLALKKLRAIIKKAAPKAAEGISYGMPAFKLDGPLVYFGGFKKHIGFFPASSGIRVFKKQLTAYRTSKGTLQLPYDKPLPASLINKIVRFRVKENAQKARTKKK